MQDNEIAELKSLITTLTSEIKNVNDKQNVMMADVKSIKDVVYNPENGLYARIKDIENWEVLAKESIRDNATELYKAKEELRDAKEKSKDLEHWQKNVSKFIWTAGLALSGLICKALFESIIN